MIAIKPVTDAAGFIIFKMVPALVNQLSSG